MRRTRIIAITAYVVGVLLIGAFAVVFAVGALLIGLSSSGVTDRPGVSVTGRVVSVAPGEQVGTCTVTYAFGADGAQHEGVEREPRQASWCDLQAGDAVYVSYPEGHPEQASDDYNRYWDEANRAWVRVLVVVGGAAVAVIASGVTVHVRGRRKHRLEVAAQG